jgi:hypothetical protein
MNSRYEYLGRCELSPYLYRINRKKYNKEFYTDKLYFYFSIAEIRKLKLKEINV